MSATAPRFLWRSARDRNLRARIETLCEPQLRILFSHPRVEARFNLLAKWLKLRTAPRALPVLPDVPLQSDPEELVDTSSDATTSSSKLAVGANTTPTVPTVPPSEPDISQEELDRVERVWIISELIYYLIEATYLAEFPIQAIRASLLVFLETHQALCRNPIADMDLELAYFRRLIFSTMVAQPPSYLPLLSRSQGKLVYQHVLSAYFRHYHLYKHIFSHGTMAPPALLGPPNSLHASLDTGLAGPDGSQWFAVVKPTVNEHDQEEVKQDPKEAATVEADNGSKYNSTGGRMTTAADDDGALHIPGLDLLQGANLEQVSEQLAKLRLEWDTKLDAVQQFIASRKATTAANGPAK